MHPLVVTARRPWEVIEPLEAVGASFSTVRVDPSASVGHRFVDTYRRVHQAIATASADIVVIDVYDVPGLAAWAAAKRAGTSILVRLVGDKIGDVVDDQVASNRTVGSIAGQMSHRVTNVMNRRIISAATGAIMVSSELKTRYCERGLFGAHEVAVVPVPFRPDAFTATPANASDGELILSVTNLAFKRKFDGICDALEGIQTVLERRQSARYVIAGGGRFEAPLRQYVERHCDPALRERITVAGFVDDIASLYANADVLVYISYLDGYPNVVLEAQGCGLPVVANDALGMRDQITDGETGRLIDPTADGQLTHAVIELLEDEHTREQLGTNARERVERENARSVIGAQLQDAFTKLSSE
ncbi:glycosyltransferase family 4 protein [Natronolimnobius sp. AArcel1]|uniref:glycosyltransferase n=1 Tax=Natronolimnobius sp. AArcel1 TaxID=1679093 RepID=UPI0013EBC48C|nr:glycosyltransferase [Natronolimnobius sp. AArcel1]NGM70316.1 glycosyltransferase family 4 protein [Natronolimnobius sp. AArcel1]